MKKSTVLIALTLVSATACSSSNDNDNPPAASPDAGTATDGAPTVEAGTIDGAAPPPPATYAEWCAAIRGHLVIDCGKSNREAAAEEAGCLAAESCADQLYGINVPVQLLACFAKSCTFDLEACWSQVYKDGRPSEQMRRFIEYRDACMSREYECRQATPQPPSDIRVCETRDFFDLRVFDVMDTCLDKPCGAAPECGKGVRERAATACAKTPWRLGIKGPYNQL